MGGHGQPRVATGSHGRPRAAEGGRGRPRAATGGQGIVNNEGFRWQRPLGKFISVLFCFGIRRDEEKETQHINIVGKFDGCRLSPDLFPLISST